MKVNKIYPCVCIDRKPENCDEGMPDIAVGQGNWFSCYCRKCGRGGRFLQYNSAFKAIRAWNEMQKSLWRGKVYRGFTDAYNEDIEEWQIEIWQEISKDWEGNK